MRKQYVVYEEPSCFQNWQMKHGIPNESRSLSAVKIYSPKQFRFQKLILPQPLLLPERIFISHSFTGRMNQPNHSDLPFMIDGVGHCGLHCPLLCTSLMWPSNQASCRPRIIDLSDLQPCSRRATYCNTLNIKPSFLFKRPPRSPSMLNPRKGVARQVSQNPI